MAHVVQAGTARPKIRSNGVVAVFGFLTGGIYTLWWWHRTARDMRDFEVSAGGGSPINVAVETALPIGALLIFIGSIGPGIMAGFRAAQAQSLAAQTGAPMPVAEPESSSLSFVGFMAAWALSFYLLYRMRSHVVRVGSKAGLLPEERGGAVSMYAVNLFLGIYFSTAQLQQQLNVVWLEFPRYYASLGGTKEEVVSADGEAPTTTPPPAQAHVPVARPQTPPAIAAAPAPADRMHELAPRAATGSLTTDESLEYARAIESVHGAEQAAPWFRFITEREPSCKAAAWWLGVYSLDRRDDAGIEMLHRVMGDPTFDSWARERVAVYLEASGRAEHAAQYRPAA